MIKNEKGITLITLAITIIVLAIIASISINFGKDTLTEVENKKIMTELSSIQQAIFERYILIKSYEKEGIIPESNISNMILEKDINRPKELVGIRIVSISTLENNYGFTNYKTLYTTSTPYEEYYYILTKEDLKLLGIDTNSVNKDYSYIVNYSTGEVFDIAHSIYIEEYDKTLKVDAELDGTTTKVEEKQYNFT